MVDKIVRNENFNDPVYLNTIIYYGIIIMVHRLIIYNLPTKQCFYYVYYTLSYNRFSSRKITRNLNIYPIIITYCILQWPIIAVFIDIYLGLK